LKIHFYFFFSEKAQKWRARIGSNRKYTYLGYFNTELEAATAYNKAALKYHKEFAKINSL